MPRILVINDSGLGGQLISAALWPTASEVRTEEHSLRGLRASRAYRPDLIIIDVAEPEMDGVACVASLRSDRNFLDTRIVMVLPEITAAFKKHLALYGVVDVVAKDECFLPSLQYAITAALAEGCAEHSDTRAWRVSA